MMLRVMTFILVFALSAAAALSQDVARPPVIVEVEHVNVFATGEFMIVIDRLPRRRLEVWSYNPEADQLEYVMSAPGYYWPLQGASPSCCMLLSHDETGNAFLHVGGVGRETVTHRLGGGWSPNLAGWAGRDAELSLKRLVGDPPRLLVFSHRSYWTYFSFWGDLDKRESIKWRLELRDPWTNQTLDEITGDGPLPDWRYHGWMELTPNLYLLDGLLNRLLSIEPFRMSDADLGRPVWFQRDKPSLAVQIIDVGEPMEWSDVEGDLRRVPRERELAVQRLHVDAESSSVTLRDVGRLQVGAFVDDAEIIPGGDLIFLRRKPSFGPIEVFSAPDVEPAVSTSFDSDQGNFYVHHTGVYVLAYYRRNVTGAVDVWALTPEGTFVKTRTLDMTEASRRLREGE